MSDRFSSSPTLRIRLVESRLRAAGHGVLSILLCCALYAVYELGYILCSVVVLPLAVSLLWLLRRDPHAGTVLCWEGGVWSLENAGRRQVIEPGRRCVVTPFVIYLSYSSLAERYSGGLWLYVDSLSRQEQRQLRVRLALMR